MDQPRAYVAWRVRGSAFHIGGYNRSLTIHAFVGHTCEISIVFDNGGNVCFRFLLVFNPQQNQ